MKLSAPVSFLLLSALLVSAFGLAGCGLNHLTAGQTFSKRIDAEGPIATKFYPVQAFSALRLSGGGDIVLIQGPAHQLAIKGADNQVAQVDVAVVNGILEIHPRGNVKFSPALEFRITCPDLKIVEIDGGFDVRTEGGPLEPSAFTFNFTGRGSIRIALNAPSLTTNLNGVLSAQFLGVVKSMEALIDGTGNFDSRNLLADDVSIELKGMGDADIFASRKLVARATGVGSIAYRGNPSQVDRHARGVGTIKAY